MFRSPSLSHNSVQYSENCNHVAAIIHRQLIGVDRKASDLIHYNEPLTTLIAVGKAHEVDFASHVSFDELRNMVSSENKEKYGLKSKLVHPEREPHHMGSFIGSDSAVEARKRAEMHLSNTNIENRSGVMNEIYNVEKYEMVTNFPLLILSSCCLAAAAYNVRRSNDPGPGADFVATELKKMRLFCSLALGYGEHMDHLEVHLLRSTTACGIFAYDSEKNLVVVSFRGTKENVDAITDVTCTSKTFKTKVPDKFNLNVDFEMKVHSGFINAFDSVKDQIDDLLTYVPEGADVLITGHSLGGALAQLGAAYYAHLSPVLITFGMPSVGNDDFVEFVEMNVHPNGGIRVHNEDDVVPEAAKIAGHQHSGVPIKTYVKESAKQLYLNCTVGEILPTFHGLAPHIIFTWGGITVSLPPGIGAKEHHDFGLGHLN